MPIYADGDPADNQNCLSKPQRFQKGVPIVSTTKTHDFMCL